jgi:hypothetical protein
MKKNYSRILLFISSLSFLNIAAANKKFDMTAALHEEVHAHKNPNITKETHPVLYDLIEDLVNRADQPMPRYITTYKAEYTVISENRVAQRAVHDIKASVDLLGDMHICYELLTDLTYDEVEGVIALAIAEKKIQLPAKAALTGITTFIATVGLIYYLNKTYDLQLGQLAANSSKPGFLRTAIAPSHSEEKARAFLVSAVLTPPVLASVVAANHAQRTIDTKAAELTSPETIINAIRGMARVTETYVKEDIFSRIATALYLKPIYHFLFYPVRSFTDDERVAYLQSASYC